VSVRPHPSGVSTPPDPLLPGEPDARARFLVGFAVLAPSSRNTQPWRFEVGHGAVGLAADESRRQPVADPDGRELYLSLGCALENLLVAAEQFGLRHTVSYFPTSERPTLAAVVTLEPGGAPTRVRSGLTLGALRERRTARGDFRILNVPPEVAWQLQSVALERDVRLDLTDNRSVKRELAALTARAARRLGGDRSWRREFARRLESDELGLPRLVEPLARLALRHLDVGPALARHEARLLGAAPLVGLVSSHDDDRLAWIRSGQLLERVWLEASARGLSLQPMSEALQLPDSRRAVGKLISPSGFYPQAIVRLGYATRASERPTARRPLEDVLT